MICVNFNIYWEHMNEFSESLKAHLAFLARSCELYDQGYKEEALRLAVSLRVIFHDTKQSTSLLQHLNLKDKIKLISTFVSPKSMGDRFGNIIWHTVIPLMLTSNGVKAPTNTWSARSNLLIDDWWNEEIWVENVLKLSRKDIVSSAANQDGGAHLDANPSTKTRALKTGPIVTVKINGKLVEDGLTNHHYPLIRQISYEVLKSNELFMSAHRQ